MILSDFGTIANTEWHESFKIRSELFLDEFIIMPNHLHALIVLKRQKPMKPTEPMKSPQKMPQRKPKSISSFVAGFKSATITKIDDFIDFYGLSASKYNKGNKLWQTNYHDHIVRNKEEYWKIKNYIRNNPANWRDDKFFE